MEYKYTSRSERDTIELAENFEAEKFLTNGEMLAITKILIATRTLPQDKMNQLVEKLEGFASTKDKKRLKELVKRELYHYKPVATLCNDLIDNLYFHFFVFICYFILS